MILVRRFLVFQAFLLWQGGFVFYAAVVVPIGTDFLQAPSLQGMITQQVTHWLNAFGLLWAILYGWDSFAVRESERRLQNLRRTIWGLCLAMLFGLLWLHRKLDAMIDFEKERVADKGLFYPWHEAYLWVSTIHWILAMILAFLTLRAWRNFDRRMALPTFATKDRT